MTRQESTHRGPNRTHYKHFPISTRDIRRVTWECVFLSVVVVNFVVVVVIELVF